MSQALNTFDEMLPDRAPPTPRRRKPAPAPRADTAFPPLAEDAHHPAPARLGPTDGVVLLRGSDITMRPIAWIWPGWLAEGKFHVLAGAPGQGKTTIAIGLAAAITSGGYFPGGIQSARGNVLVWSGEDDPNDTLLPRLVAAGGNPANLYFVTGARVDGEVLPFDPARDMAQLIEAAEQIGGVRLLIVDPVVSAVTGDSHKNTEVRRALQPLVDLAAITGAAVLGISHFSKGGQGQDPTQRVVGSIAFSAVARVVLVAAKVKTVDGEDRRILARSKSNIGPDDGGFEYHLDQVEVAEGVMASRIAWGQDVAGSARELLSDPNSDDDEERTAAGSAEDFLRELLAEGPMPSKQVKSDATEAGYAWITVRRAADALDVQRKKGGLQEGWYWRMPEGAQKQSKVLTPNDEQLRESLSTFGTATDQARPTGRNEETF